MAKKSKIAKNKKRQETVEKYRAIREEMKKNKDYNQKQEKTTNKICQSIQPLIIATVVKN